ncbi:MAG: PepSY domain-containing protein, partial [bacterium]
MKHTYFASWSMTLLIVWVLFSAQDLSSQNKPEYNRSREIINDVQLQTTVKGSARVEELTGITRAVYRPDYTAVKAQPEEMALQYLKDNAFRLTLQRSVNDLQHERTIQTPAGTRVQFVQKAGGYPVYNADIRVSLNSRNEVVFVTNSYKPIIHLSTDVKLDQTAALEIARDHIGITGSAVHESVEEIVYPVDNDYATVAYLVKAVPAEEHFGDWELIVDASTGKILRAEDKACYHQPDGEVVDGSGWVFDPDPVTNASKVYGITGFTDNDDADNDSLTAQLKEVVLNDITYEDGLYKLAGPNAVIVDVESPFTGLYEQDSSNFHFTRSQGAFEATEIYFHVDQSMRYLNDSLGFSVMPFQYEGGVQFDPHGLGGDVNAHYVGSAG